MAKNDCVTEKPNDSSWQIQPRLRVRLDDNIALGPGKIELLEQVHATGSISEAAKRLGMSYMRAWTLIRTMNKSFKTPLISAARGGSHGGGGASLTATGKTALKYYHRMNSACLKATAKDWKALQELLKS